MPFYYVSLENQSFYPDFSSSFPISLCIQDGKNDNEAEFWWQPKFTGSQGNTENSLKYTGKEEVLVAVCSSPEIEEPRSQVLIYFAEVSKSSI